MSVVRSLRIQLGDVGVGSLFGLEDGRVYFRFDDAYVAMGAHRPVLAQAYVAGTEAATAAQLADPGLAANVGSGEGGLPPFFANLLPEGRLRAHLVDLAGIAPDDSLALLAYCGEDLPGDVAALGERLDERAMGRLLTQGRDSYEFTSGQLPLPDAVSISGVQPKVALVQDPGGRYVMRSKTDGGRHFIGKLPASDYAAMPEVEFSAMALAKAAGVNVCECSLMPLTAIASQLPFALREDDRNFLLVHRFDRDAPTANGRLHVEDLAQAMLVQPGLKCTGGSYAAIGVVLERSADPLADRLELLRRIKVNELLGNYDAHLKNFSLLYDARARTFRLSPAYDIVAHSVYMNGSGNALALVPGLKRRTLGPAVVRALANAWRMPENLLTRAVTEVVDAAMTQWPALLESLPLTPAQRVRLLHHMNADESAASWLARRIRPAAR